MFWGLVELRVLVVVVVLVVLVVLLMLVVLVVLVLLMVLVVLVVLLLVLVVLVLSGVVLGLMVRLGRRVSLVWRCRWWLCSRLSPAVLVVWLCVVAVGVRWPFRLR